MLNYRFNIRIDKCKQMQNAYYLRRVFTREIIAKFAKEDVVYLNDIYPSVLKKIVYNMGVYVHVYRDAWEYIPVRTPEDEIDKILKKIVEDINKAKDEALGLLDENKESDTTKVLQDPNFGHLIDKIIKPKLEESIEIDPTFPQQAEEAIDSEHASEPKNLFTDEIVLLTANADNTKQGNYDKPQYRNNKKHNRK